MGERPNLIDTAFLERHCWFSEACNCLFVAQPAVLLDG
jgi:hypothetical protein